jgi:ubiquinone/menaquinone biosynthesis C-methylase UbiE
MGESQDKKAEIEFFSTMVKESKVSQICSWDDSKFERVLKYLTKVGCNNKKALDLGCGPGDFTLRLSSLGLTIIGIDISQDLLKINKQKNPTSVFICGDAENLPFENEKFDVVVATFLLHHFRTHERVMKELYRVLKGGGFFLSVEPNKWNPVTWYQHNTSLGKRKYNDSLNEKIFSPFYLKNLLNQWFEIVEFKTINFDFIKLLTPLEGIFETLFPINMFGGSIVVFGRKVNLYKGRAD